MDDLIQKYGVQTLKAIMKRKNRARYSEILEDFPATSGTLSRVLKALEEKGLIKRIVDPDSRPPTSYYTLTEDGEKLVDEDISQSFMALMEFDLEKAQRLLDDLINQIKEKRK